MITKNINIMQKNNGITVLRGIFITMIVLHHLGMYDGGGSLGVTSFFMLSGFALSMGYYDSACKSNFSYISFVKKRCEKFYPLHWLCLFAILPLYIIPVLKEISNLKAALITLLPNALLVQSLIPIKSFYFSYNAVSWYLSATMILTLTFPYIVKILHHLTTSGKMFFFIIIVITYANLVFFLPKEHRHAILYINPCVRIVDFTLGIYIYIIYKNLLTNASQHFIKAIGLISISVTMLIASIIISIISSQDTRLIAAIYWVPLSILLLTTVLCRRCNMHLAIWIGEISFPIFITHLLVISYSNLFLCMIGWNNSPIKIVITIPLIFLVSWLCEKYLLSFISLWLRKRI